jgi:hypothetical protein
VAAAVSPALATPPERGDTPGVYLWHLSTWTSMPRPDDDDEDLDGEFPLGDGTVETETVVQCPHCGETTEIELDPGSGTTQEYVQDCDVCCRPWRVSVRFADDGTAQVSVTPLDE